MDSRSSDQPDVYETVTNSNIVELEAVIGCISAFFGLVLAIFGVVKLYYGLSFHCKAKPTDVRVTVLSENQSAGKKVACVSWTDPQRSKFQTFMCMVFKYKVFCSGECQCKAQRIFHFLEKDKARIELQEYIEHKLQVSIGYTGKMIQAAHWSEPSNLCVVLAPPSCPFITEISLNKNRVPTIFFKSPKHANGDIVEYLLSCKVEGQAEGREFQIIHNQVQHNLFGATLHVPLQPLVTYLFRLAALSFRGKVEFHGEWSEEFRFSVPVDCVTDRMVSWSQLEWHILTVAVVNRIGSHIFALISVLGFTEAEKDNLTIPEVGNQGKFDGIARNALASWKRKLGQKGTLRALHKHLMAIELISMAEHLKACCEKEGIIL